MSTEELLYEFIKEMNLSLAENERKMDVDKIKSFFSFYTPRRILLEISRAFQNDWYENINIECKSKKSPSELIPYAITIMGVDIKEDEFRKLNAEAKKEKNYLIVEKDYAYCRDEKNKELFWKQYPGIKKCLDKLLAEKSEIFYWNNAYHFDIREVKKDKIKNLIYNEGDAKKKYNELNELIKKIFIKEHSRYRDNIGRDIFDRLEIFLVNSIPVIDGNGEMKPLSVYWQQRKDIRDRLRLCIIENKEKKRVEYKNKAFEAIISLLSEENRKEIILSLEKLQNIEEEAVYYFKNIITEVSFYQLESLDKLVNLYKKEVLIKRSVKGIIGRYEYEKLKSEEYLAQLKEEIDEEEYILLCEMIQKLDKEDCKGHLDEEDYIECYENAYYMWINSQYLDE